jgi:hypothetical protein
MSSLSVSWQRSYNSISVTKSSIHTLSLDRMTCNSTSASTELLCAVVFPFSCLNSDPIQSQRQSYFTTGSILPISSSWRQATWDPRPVILFFNWTLAVSPYVTFSLTRGRVCRLQLLLSSPAQSYSGPSPAGLMTTFYRLRFETPPTWRTRSLYLYPPGTGWPGYTRRHWVTNWYHLQAVVS